MSRKSLLFMCAFILCLVVCALLDGEYAVKAKAVTGEADNVTVDISGLRGKCRPEPCLPALSMMGIFIL